MSPFRERRLNLAMIETSSEIQHWLSQFRGRDRDVATDMLLRLHFVPRDTFSEWVRQSISNIGSNEVAIYSARKMPWDVESLWDSNGQVIGRPGHAQGSEDFVYSIIRQLCRESEKFLDNPDLGTLKGKHIRDMVLLDDSIGSGKRVADFVSRMFKNKTLMSWWSYGLLKIHVVSYARTREGEKKILSAIPGSDHPKRRFPRSRKVAFHSKIVYGIRHLEIRWGNRYTEILQLCDTYTQIPKGFRRGYGQVMGNIVFYHSVPNNIPGVLFFSNQSWQPFFHARTISEQMINLLESRPHLSQTSLGSESKQELVLFISLVRRGIRRRNSLSLRMDLDTRHIQGLIEQAVSMGFIDEKLRPTKVGIEFLKKNGRLNERPGYDYSIYVPGSWCAGRRTIQPSSPGLSGLGKADSTAVTAADGEVGKASLARTDATAASPPMNVAPQEPSVSRKGRDIHGPKGLKEE